MENKTKKTSRRLGAERTTRRVRMAGAALAGDHIQAIAKNEAFSREWYMCQTGRRRQLETGSGCGNDAGPLFCNVNKAARISLSRLTGQGIWHISGNAAIKPAWSRLLHTISGGAASRIYRRVAPTSSSSSSSPATAIRRPPCGTTAAAKRRSGLHRVNCVYPISGKSLPRAKTKGCRERRGKPFCRQIGINTGKS
jgi:hypothetical protein